ncbi:MAG: DUF4395 domain-containing protein [Kineosporiaceae bacterium]|nr:DUF4395 domain-containing protein [Kineosporiaceae bacterium]
MTAVTAPPVAGIDPRGPRFAAALTSVVLAVTVLTGTIWVLAAQVALFAVGAFAGVQRTPYAAIFRRVIRPRLSPPAELEDPAPPRFAQLVGLVVTGVALLAALAGVGLAVEIGAGLALIAAFLNAVFGLCLGCELYLLIRRARG